MLLQVLPVVAYIGFIIIAVLMAMGRVASPMLRWGLPAAVGVFFAAFSIITLAQDGVMQFWYNHTINLAGNQVWFDLIFAVLIALYLIAPRARAVGMSMLPWTLAVLMTACVALLPMLARVIWLEQKA